MWFKTSLITLGALAAMPAFGAPGDANADVFYRDAQALMAKGVGAMFDKRTKPMMAEMKAAGLAAKTENQAATARGKPLYCVPEAQRKKGLDVQRIIDMIGRIPAEQRRAMTVKAAWRSALIREYPC
ncbi:hypothetical protein [Qipengyuania sp.]|uniref:hypothetical protein n=1 Tax=Qipengyuania sp. TaxID=2004515 RepID=UPI0035C7B754